MRELKKKVRRACRSMRWLLKHPLARRDRLGALKRYITFHVLYPLLPGPVVYPWVGNLRFIVQPGMGGVVGNVYAGLEDFEEMALILHALREGDVFVDVGANVGAYTLLASGICGARTIAIEPVPSTFEHLLLNVRLNQLDNVVDCRNVGVWSHATCLRFTTGFDTMNRVVENNAGNEAGTTVVEVFPLDQILADTRPVAVKVDVEGCEYQVLQGAPRTLSDETLRCIIVETYEGYDKRYGHTVEEVRNLLDSYGFAPYVYNPFERTFAMGPRTERRGFNEIYVRDIGFLASRVREAPSFEVLGVTL